MSKYDDLVRKLKEIFQIDRPELDFGVYRILNTRAQEVNDYLENGLKNKVTQSLAESGAGNLEALQKELAEKEAQYRADGLDPNNVPKVKELKQRISELGAGSADHENAVFTHLLTFFSRYYDKGDFISQRRFKGDTYAIPYAGEEVVLHWANKEQYYTKSGENFANYGFKLDDGRSVQFKLVAADTAKDNRKDNDKDRLFVLIENHVRTFLDEEGKEYEVELSPVEELNNELVIRFDYKAMPKGTKQEALISSAVERLLSNPIIKSRWQELGRREPTEKNAQRTLLEKCLTSYAAKNLADYFIHKDLGRYLGRELDFYVKNEVMNLDDVAGVNQFSEIERSLRIIQTLRSIALDLIAFLDQLENFQKRLWLKKKFVVSANYCVTLDRIPQSLYQAIADNTKQWEQWSSLGFLTQEDGLFATGGTGSVEYLLQHPFLLVDTSLFDLAFKARLLAEMDSLDERLDGLLIHSDNFQALNLIQNRYAGAIACIHIDPPYNTDTSGFAYKNNFRHSSWLTMMKNRTELAVPLLTSTGQFVVHIDENEYERLHLLFDEAGLDNAGTVVWDKRNPMNGGSGVAMQHEYIVWRTAGPKKLTLPNDSVMSMMGMVRKLIEEEGSVTDSVRKKYASWLNANDSLSGGEKAYRYIDADGRIYQSVSLRAPEPRTDEKFFRPLIHPVTKNPCAVPPNGFSRTPETLNSMMERGEILFGSDETTQPRQKVVLTEATSRQLSSLVQDAMKGKSETAAMGIDFPYCHPSSLYKLIVNVAAQNDDVVLDFFAGSGTTGHAVIEANKSDRARRKFILVEQGEYFDAVTKPRIQKAVYSSDWKDGKALNANSGISFAFKVLKLESYEDTLNNLHLRRNQAQQTLLSSMNAGAKEEYLLRYMLEVESRQSLLTVDKFAKPFDYSLKVSVDSAGAYEERKVDLVETFNLMLGIKVKNFDAHYDLGFVTVSGLLPNGDKALILWRDVEQVDYQSLNRLCEKLAINPADSEFDVVYINGDHNIPAVFTSTEAEGGVTKSLKIRQIEPEFLSRMFNVDA